MIASRFGISLVLIVGCWADGLVAAQDKAKSDSKSQAAGKADAAKFPKLDTVEEYVSRARELREKHQYPQAKRDLDEALRLDSTSVPALVGRAWTWFFMGHGKEALDDCNAALKLDPQSAEAYRARSNADYLNKRYDLELADMQEYIRLQPDDAGAYNHRAIAYERNHQLDQALEDYNKAIELDPSQALFFQNRANLLVGRGRWEEALADYNQTVRLEPSNSDRFRLRGDTYTNHKDYEKAIADFNEAIRLKPKEGASSYGGRGWVYFNQQDYVHAIADFDEAINLDAKNALHRYRRGLVYKALKNNERALDDFSQAVKLDPSNFDYLANRAQANFDLKKNDEATADYSEMIRRQPKKAIYYAYRGNALAAKREFARAVDDYSQAIELDPKTAGLYENRGNSYRALRKWDLAQADYEKCLEIRKTYTNKARQPRMADSLTDLGILFEDKGDFETAQPYLEQALALRQEALGNKDAATAQSISYLGLVLWDRGDFAAARAKMEEALAIERDILPAKHLQTAQTLGYLGNLVSQMGDMAAARPYIEESLAIRRELLGPRHLDTAGALWALAGLMRSEGDYAAARSYFQQVHDIRKEILGPQHPLVARSLTDLGLTLKDMGDYAAAQSCFEQALAIHKEALGAKHPATINDLNFLGDLLVKTKDYQQARTYLEQALALRKEVLGATHPATAVSLASLGSLCSKTGDFAQARSYNEEALEIRKAALGPKHPVVANTLSSIGTDYRCTGDYAQARSYYDQALAIRREALGPNHPFTAASLMNLALLGAATGDWRLAQSDFNEARHIVRSHVARVLPGLSPKEQASFLAETDEKQFHDALSLGLLRRDDDADLAELSYGWLVNGKAVVQEAIAQHTVLARQSGDPDTISTVKELQDVRSQLASLTYLASKSDGEETRRTQVAKLESREDELSRRLAEIPGLSAPANPWVETSAVRQAIGADAVLIDIAQFDVRDFKSTGKDEKFGPPHYAAWLVRPADQGATKIIDLGPADKIDAAVQAVRTGLERSIKEMRHAAEQNKPFDNLGQEKSLKAPLADLAKLILEPVLKSIPRETKQLIVSPDASLWLVPWAALPLKDGRYAVEQYEIRYLVSGRDLLTRKIAASLKPTTPIVFADPNYDLNQNETKLAGDPKSRGGDPVKDGTKHDNDKTRDVEAAKSASALPKVSRLPGTAIEAAAIKSSLASYAHGQPIVYTDARALESTFKSVRRPRVVVLATHGFFLPDQKVKTDSHENGGESSANERSVPTLLDANGQPIENPLLRCGLLLAGCNSRTKAQTGSDDGILTGMEIIGTDLRGTELVVLSACETGLGQIHNGEGVAGLRQAFQLAGAQSVVATLWQIPDSDSSAIMSTFFEKLAGGDSKVESLRQAQLARIATLRQRFAAAPVVLWGAFTITGQ